MCEKAGNERETGSLTTTDVLFRLSSCRIREIMERVGPIFEVMRGVTPPQPAIAALLRSSPGKRSVGRAHFDQALPWDGPLRPGLSPHEPAATVWTIISAEMYRLLARGRSAG